MPFLANSIAQHQPKKKEAAVILCSNQQTTHTNRPLTLQRKQHVPQSTNNKHPQTIGTAKKATAFKQYLLSAKSQQPHTQIYHFFLSSSQPKTFWRHLICTFTRQTSVIWTGLCTQTFNHAAYFHRIHTEIGLMSYETERFITSLMAKVNEPLCKVIHDICSVIQLLVPVSALTCSTRWTQHWVAEIHAFLNDFNLQYFKRAAVNCCYFWKHLTARYKISFTLWHTHKHKVWNHSKLDSCTSIGAECLCGDGIMEAPYLSGTLWQ